MKLLLDREQQLLQLRCQHLARSAAQTPRGLHRLPYICTRAKGVHDRRSSCAIRAQTTLTADAPAKAEIDWDNLGFGISHVAPVMYTAQFIPGMGWQGGLQPYGPLQLEPSAQVLNYGQSVFEGLKAQRTAKGRVVLFRPEENAARLQAGAARLVMPEVSAETFALACMSVVAGASDYVPPLGKGSLYLRPLLLGTGPILGLGPAPSFTFTVFGAAVGTYFRGGQLTPVDLIVEEHFHRAAPGGMGGTKAAGNYSPVLLTQSAAKERGYADVVYLDAKTDTLLEEVSSCNIFVVKGRKIRTPALQGTILPGVTRKSVIQLARHKGYEVEEGDCPIAEALEADEIFTCGTAVVVLSVGSITYKGQRKQYTQGGPGPVARDIYEDLTAIQQERADDLFGWVREVPFKL